MVLKILKKYFTINKDQYKEQTSDKIIEIKNKNIEANVHKTASVFKTFYSYPDNSDVVFRNVKIGGHNKQAVILFIKTITDTQIIDNDLIAPLLRNKEQEKAIPDIIANHSATNLKQIGDILNAVNQGSAALFVDGEKEAYVFDVAEFKGRNIEQTQNEIVVKGPKEAFNEKVDDNISLIRKKIKNENLVVESVTISKRSNNELYIVYNKDLANEKLLHNIKNRVSSLDIDAIQNLSLLEQHIEERSKSIFPTVLYTERPDRAVSFIEDGFIALLMNNSPDTLVLPATFWSFYHTAEDHYLRFPYGNFIRGLRMFAFMITLFGSAAYVAVTRFHSEMIPPDLLLAIASTREKVPFPAFIEVLLMEIAFELIREAGLRVPVPIGPTIGIVGALILGQAAVQANIVSPIVVIVVALGGLCSFVIGDISMNYAIRICRFAFIIAGGLFGAFGMIALFVAGLFYLVSIKSFGVPYLAPYSPKYLSGGDTIFRKLIDHEIFRPGFLKPKDMEKSKGDH